MLLKQELNWRGPGQVRAGARWARKEGDAFRGAAAACGAGLLPPLFWRLLRFVQHNVPVAAAFQPQMAGGGAA